jgi:hypothetical protein
MRGDVLHVLGVFGRVESDHSIAIYVVRERQNRRYEVSRRVKILRSAVRISIHWNVVHRRIRINEIKVVGIL